MKKNTFLGVPTLILFLLIQCKNNPPSTTQTPEVESISPTKPSRERVSTMAGNQLAYKVTTVPNQINWQQFGNFALPNTLTAIWGYGSPRYTNEKGSPTDALAHGWTHTDSPSLNGSSKLPTEKISGFSVIENILSCCVVKELLDEGKRDANSLNPQRPNWGAVSNSLAQSAGRRVYWHSWGGYDPDVKDYAIRNSFIVYDQELPLNTDMQVRGRVMANIFKGIQIERGNRPLNLCYYGGLISSFIGSYNVASKFGIYNDNEEKFSPYYTDVEKNRFKSHTGLLNATFAEYPTYFDVGAYFKVSYPKAESLYKKNPDGSYAMKNSKRIWRDTNFSETIDGIRTNFYATPQAGTESWYNGSYIPESWYAVRQFYNMYDKIVYNRYAVRDFSGLDENLSELDKSNIKLMTVQRDETEPTYFSLTTETRQLTANIGEFMIGCAFGTGIRTYYNWTIYGNRTHPSQQNQNVYSARPYGSDYYVSERGYQKRFWGFYEGMTAGLKFISDANKQYSFFDGNEKIILATEPSNTTHEIILCGQIRGNQLFLFGKAPYFDVQDNTIITVSTSKNQFSQKIQLSGRNNLWQVLTLPEGNYSAEQIRFEYKDELGNTHKVTGDLRKHNW